MRLKDKVAIITGAGGGIGKAIALLFAAEGAGVIALDTKHERLDRIAAIAAQKGHVILPVAGDVTSEKDVGVAVALAAARWGRVDILVNNAGTMDDMMPVGELSDALWDRVMDVNLKAPMQLTRKVLEGMVAQGRGSIINIASVCGLQGGRAGAAYTASKHGLIGLTKNTAFMYADKGIRCNAICPGYVATELYAAGLSAPSALGMERALAGRSLSPRAAQPEEIAGIALFLASDESGSINGAAMVADSGWTAY